MSVLDVRGIRVNIDDKKHDIYLSLRSQSATKSISSPFATMKDLFICAACLGAKNNYFKQIKNRRDIFSGEMFSAQLDVPILAALAYHKTGDVEVLSNPKEVMEINESWANGGIEVLNQKLLSQSGFPLVNLVDMILDEYESAKQT